MSRIKIIETVKALQLKANDPQAPAAERGSARNIANKLIAKNGLQTAELSEDVLPAYLQGTGVKKTALVGDEIPNYLRDTKFRNYDNFESKDAARTAKRDQ